MLAAEKLRARIETRRRFLKAAELLDRLGVDAPEQIHVEAIAEYCGATVVQEKLSGAEARIVGFRDRAIITVNSGSSRERQRFSAAHELGHWMHDRGEVSRGCTTSTFISQWSRYNPEVRANRFAAELLMPARLFRESARGRPMTFDTVMELAGRYQTSLTATAMRLLDCSGYPAMLVCTRRGRREWFRRSPQVPMALSPVTRLSDRSMAARIARGQTAPGPAEVSAEAWLARVRKGGYHLHEDSIRLGRDYILTLLWWRTEADLPLIEGY